MKIPKIHIDIRKVKRYLPTVLTGVSIAGVAVTAYTSYKAGYENCEWDDYDLLPIEDKKKFQRKACVPMVISASVTIGTIIFNQRLNTRQKAELTAAVACLSATLNDFQKEILERHPDEYQEIKNTVYDKHPEIADVDMISFTDYGCLACDSVNLGAGGDDLFYDPFCDRWFRSSLLAVTAAEYHLNRNFALRGDCTLAEFYGFLGLGIPAELDGLGWECTKLADEMDAFWIDFGHNKVTDRCGKEEPFYELMYVMEPYYIKEYSEGL